MAYSSDEEEEVELKLEHKDCWERCRRFYSPNDEDRRLLKELKKKQTKKYSVTVNFNEETWTNCATKLVLQFILLAGSAYYTYIYGILYVKAYRYNDRCDADTCQTVLYDMCYVPPDLMLEFFSEYAGNNTETFSLDDFSSARQPYQDFSFEAMDL